MPLYIPNSVPNTSVTGPKTTTYSVLSTDGIVTVDGTSAAFTVTLPTAVGVAGKQYTIKRVDQTLANLVTVATTSSQTIDGATTRKLATQYEQFTLVSDGANWQVVSHTYPSGKVVYTLAIGGTTTAPTKATSPLVDLATWARVGDSVEVAYTYQQSSATGASAGSGNYIWGLPPGITPDASKLAAAQTNGSEVNTVGTASIMFGSAATLLGGFMRYEVGTGLYMYSSETSTGYTVVSSGSRQIAGNAVLGYSFTAKIPISGWEP